MSERNYILWTIKVYYEFPASITPECIDEWWAETGPDFPEWVECESERIVCESISLQDIEIPNEGWAEVTYVIHLSFDLSVPYEDATEELNNSLPDIVPDDGFEVEGIDTVELKHYTR